MFPISRIALKQKPVLGQVLQRATYIVPTKKRRTIVAYEPLPTAHKDKNLMRNLMSELYERYDPQGWKRELISKKNPKGMRAGDIVAIYTKPEEGSSSSAPFVGYVLAIDRNGPDSTFLVRSNVTRVGVETRFSLFSPLIERIDFVMRPTKYNGRSRHYYIRNTKLDIDDVENLLRSRKRK